MSAAALAAAAVCSSSSTQQYSGMVRDGGGGSGSTAAAAAAFKQGRLAVQPIPPNHTCENLPVVQQQVSAAARSGGVAAMVL